VAVIDQRLLDLQGKPIAPPTVVLHRYRFEEQLLRRIVCRTRSARGSGTRLKRS